MQIVQFIKILLLFILMFFLIYVSLLIFFSKYEFFKILFYFFLIFFLFKFWQEIKEIFPFSLIKKLNLVDFDIRSCLMNFFLLLPFIIKAPYLRYRLQNFNFLRKNKQFIVGSSNTHRQILESVLEMSKKKIGALITLEKYNSLQQYAQKSILIDGNVSKELLLNIFIPNTPLHDGAVIIRGNRILSAGAYFMLSEKQNFKKNQSGGSRHLAALGISEITDSMTIVVSEETGNISIALEGILLKIEDAEQIKEYLETFIL
ncbi:MAG: DNA integrity scanning protein DisA nucleotide-binding domain protein [Candidatus Phytoplasma stylosanthis]|nr:DNA integrity scanning protein DisA nucleotide-binding domain protein [Candidatus Phytoplasma stylosanthis]